MNLPEKTCQKLSLEGQAQILHEFNATITPYPKDKLIHEIIAEQAEFRPDEIALICDDGTISYAELIKRVHGLAWELRREHSVRPDDLIALVMERSIEMVVSLLAIMEAGGACVPIDPSYPVARMKFILNDCNSPLLLTNVALDPSVLEVVTVKEIRPDSGPICDPAPPRVTDGSNLIYCLYTSGSSGTPKGVLVEHEGVRNVLQWSIECLLIAVEDRVLQRTPYTFDVAFMELFAPLMCGAKVVLIPHGAERIPEAVRDAIIRHEVTVLQFVPSALMSHLSYFDENPLGNATRCVCVGEALKSGLSRAFHRATNGRCKLFNFYGPTEACIYATSCLVQPEMEEITIGKPLANVRLRILDEGELCDIGEPGELCIAGVAVARGYLNRPEQTQERFVPDPFVRHERMYRTGDLAYWREDGEIIFLGRRDNQIKIRGHRVEIGEVEDALSRVDQVHDVAVAAIQVSGYHELVAYFVGDEDASSSSLRESLLKSLPAYMVPSRFIKMEALPSTPNGKLDRAALPAPNQESTEVFSGAFTDPLELELCMAFAEVLHRGDVRPSDRFLDIGGDSLRAVQVALHVRKTLNRPLDAGWLLNDHSIAELVEILRREDRSPLPRIVATPEAQWHVLSSGQLSLWLLEQAGVPHAPYTLSNVHELLGQLDEGALRGSCESLLSRHESLRTSIHEVNGELRQRAENVPMDWEVKDATVASDEEVDRLLLDFTTRSFDLAAGRLIRFLLLKRSPVKHVLVVSVHHIACDGWSQSLLVNEMLVQYKNNLGGEGRETPQALLQYRDYSQWQQGLLERGVLADSKRYWTEKLGGDLERLEMPADRSRPARSAYSGAVARRTISSHLFQRLKRYCLVERTTLYAVLCAAFRVLMYRYTGQEDFALGSAALSRPFPELHDLIGYYVNTLALRDSVSPTATFRAVTRSVHRTLLEAIKHRDYPFERVIQDLGIATGSERNPLFDVMVLLDSGWGDSAVLVEGLHIRHLPSPRRHSQIDVTLNFRETSTGLEAAAEYSTELFDSDRMERMLEHLEVLLDSALKDPDQQVRSLHLISKHERERVVVEFNQTAKVYPVDKLVHQLFAERAAERPGAIAIASSEGSLTFAALNERANRLAWKLRQAHGVALEVRVAVLMERSIEMMVAVWGIIKAGGAYVPVTVRDPIARINDILRDCGCSVVLTRGPWNGGALDEGCSTLDLLAESSYADRCDNPDVPASPENLMYCLYTSGSTGMPKGVLIEHGSVLNRLYWMVETLGLNSSDVILQKTPSVFDVSVWEMFLPGMIGAMQALLPDGGESNPETIRDSIRRYGVSTIHFVPSMLNHYLDAGEDGFLSVRRCVCSGEALSRELSRRFFAAAGTSLTELYNYYGPTEAAVDVSFHRVEDTLGPVLIGPPAPNNTFYILDEAGTPAPIGVPGQLCIGGVQVARGYLNRPELTEKYFASDPFSAGGRMYRTGDLACWNNRGDVLYLGRIDKQLKLRGHRIEPGEIEHTLCEFRGITRAVVLMQREKSTGDFLCSYLQSSTDISSDDLRQHLARRLPPYMIPSRFVRVESIPVTRNGKIDPAALIAMEPVKAGDGRLTAPASEFETTIREMWQSLLPVSQIGTEDDFFSIGGNSLTALSLCSRLAKAFGVAIKVASIFKHRTIAKQVLFVGQQARAASRPLGEGAIYPRKSQHPLSFAQERVWFLHKLEPESSVYNMPLFLRLEGEMDEDALEHAISGLVERHEVLRVTFRESEGRPYQFPNSDVGVMLVKQDLPDASEELIWDRAREESRRPFRLHEEIPLRATLLRISRTKNVLLLILHHIVADGISLQILQRELFGLYSQRMAGTAELAPLPLQYIDYAESLFDKRDVVEQELNYWVEKLAECTWLDLPQDAPAEDIQRGQSGRVSVKINESVCDKLKAVSADAQTTMFELVASALALLLSRLSNQTDVLIGFPIADRRSLELEGLIGLFLNTLVLRTDLSGNPDFQELLRRVSGCAREAHDHSSAPFELLVERLNPPRRLDQTPIFNVLLNFMPETPEEIHANGLSVFREDQFRYEAKIGLSFYVNPTATDTEIELIYRRDQYSDVRARTLVDQFAFLLKQITEKSDAPLDSYSLITPEAAVILPKLAEVMPTHDFPLMTDCIDRWAKETPARIAVTQGATSVTYAELHERTDRIAMLLNSQGCLPGDVVGLIGRRGAGFVTAMLGTFKYGAIALPLDAGLPERRLGRLLQIGMPRLLIRCGELSGEVSSMITNFPALQVDVKGVLPHGEPQDHALSSEVTPETPAYLFFTSGTSGEPRGVLGIHKGLSHFLCWQKEVFGMDTTTRCAQLTNLSFDVMLRDTLLALVSGGTVVIPEPAEETGGKAIFQWLEEQKISVLHAVPTLLQSWLLDVPPELQLPDLRWLFCAGEPLKASLVRLLRSRFPECSIVNLYGPTETTMAKAAYCITGKERVEVMPIGKPISFTQIHILRGEMPCGVGEPGEIVIRTPYRTLGYFHDPSATNGAFVANPATKDQNDLLYRTGDIGRYLHDGTLEILGRRDSQVKINGVRIEPAEIEREILAYPGVRACLISAEKDQTGETQLIAYVVANTKSNHPIESMQDHLRTILPAGMIPRWVIPLAAIPMSPNGKPDYRALPKPNFTREFRKAPPEAPRTSAEEEIAAIWKKIFGESEIGRKDNFFDIGGTSLKLLRLFALLDERFPKRFRVAQLFTHPTIATQAAMVDLAPVQVRKGAERIEF